MRNYSKFELKGVIEKIKKGITDASVFFTDLIISVQGEKFLDNIICGSYGLKAEELFALLKEKDCVIVKGRIVSKQNEKGILLKLLIETVDVIKNE